MKNIVLAWLGHTDIREIENKKSEGGPIATLLCSEFAEDFNEVHLMCSYTEVPSVLISDMEKKGIKLPSSIDQLLKYYKIHLSKRVEIDAHSHKFGLKDPTDHESVYSKTKGLIKQLQKDNDEISWHFHLSPGTPTMHAVLLLLGRSSFRATMYHTWKLRNDIKSNTRIVKVPFDIALDLIPELKKKTDHAIVHSWSELPAFLDIKFKSKIMETKLSKAHKMGVRDVPVLITGETGTGKELIAKAIHEASTRKDQEFMTINCGALPEELVESELFGYLKGAFTGADNDKPGYFELCHNGTLFMDEFGELPLKTQVKLLRVLQSGKFNPVGGRAEKEVDVRVIAATNKNLISMIDEGTFREDLFYRISVGTIELPPLRNRIEDIQHLADHFLNLVNTEYKKTSKITEYKSKKFHKSAREILINHNWPGNIRELYNTIQRVCLWCDNEVIKANDLENSIVRRKPKLETCSGIPFEIIDLSKTDNFNLDKEITKIKHKYIDEAKKICKGVKTKAAEMLGYKSFQTMDKQ